MATRGRLSSGCPFQLYTAPTLASQPPLSPSLASSTTSFSPHTHPLLLSLPPSHSQRLLGFLTSFLRDRGTLSLSPSHTSTRRLGIIHTRVNLYCLCIFMQTLSYEHTDSMCLQSASSSLLPHPSPLILTPPPTHCISSGLSWKTNAWSNCAAMCHWPCCNGEDMWIQMLLTILRKTTSLWDTSLSWNMTTVLVAHVNSRLTASQQDAYLPGVK